MSKITYIVLVVLAIFVASMAAATPQLHKPRVKIVPLEPKKEKSEVRVQQTEKTLVKSKIKNPLWMLDDVMKSKRKRLPRRRGGRPRSCLYRRSPTDRRLVRFAHNQVSYDHKICKDGLMVLNPWHGGHDGKQIVQIFENIGRIVFGNIARRYSMEAETMESENF